MIARDRLSVISRTIPAPVVTPVWESQAPLVLFLEWKRTNFQQQNLAVWDLHALYSLSWLSDRDASWEMCCPVLSSPCKQTSEHPYTTGMTTKSLECTILQDQSHPGPTTGHDKARYALKIWHTNSVTLHPSLLHSPTHWQGEHLGALLKGWPQPPPLSKTPWGMLRRKKLNILDTKWREYIHHLYLPLGPSHGGGLADSLAHCELPRQGRSGHRSSMVSQGCVPASLLPASLTTSALITPHQAFPENLGHEPVLPSALNHWLFLGYFS